MDIDAEGSVETPVLNVDDGGGGDGSTGKGDDKVSSALVCFASFALLLIGEMLHIYQHELIHIDLFAFLTCYLLILLFTGTGASRGAYSRNITTTTVDTSTNSCNH